MQTAITREELGQLVEKQINNLFFIRSEEERRALSVAIDQALERSEYSFSRTVNKYYFKNGQTYFNPFHSGQYSIFLYFLSNSLFKLFPDLQTLSDRVYYLNKALNGFDLFYEVEMPKVFFLDHPVGAVLGRATYGEGFSFSQNCTVGNNKGVFPVIGKNVQLMSGSKLIGKCEIGDDVILAANSYVKDTNIPNCSLVFGSSPDLIVKSRSR